MTDYDLAILGLGGIGSGALYWAAKVPGARVVGVEQFESGHGRGGSEDHSRIIRLSYHTPEYVALARAAYEAWAALENDGGERVILRTGGLDLAPAGATIGLDAYRESMTAAGVDFEELDAPELMRRYPQWRVGDDVTALFQERSGIAMAARANAAHRRLAEEHGATLLTTSRVTGLRESAGEVIIETGSATITTRSLIIAAGAWTNDAIGHFGVRFPLEVTLEQVVYMRPHTPDAFTPDRFPIWIWMTEPSFYGFPIFGEPAIKTAWDRCELVTDAEGRTFEPVESTTRAIADFVAEHLPDGSGAIHLEKTCLYTLTPDRDFIVDRLPGTNNVFVAVGAGHAFKFASLLGRSLVEMATHGSATVDVSGFRADRAILREANPTRNYMV